MTPSIVTLVLAITAFAPAVQAQELVLEPEGYRTDDYRSPVPETLAGGRVLSTAEAESIWRAKTGIFVDVLPRPPKPFLPAGTIWREKPRYNIPGSIWLPDTGYGQLAAAVETYLRDGLVRASGGNHEALIVVYCQANCWMSWNAAKRAVEYGYTSVYWFPGGMQDWTAAGYPTLLNAPIPVK